MKTEEGGVMKDPKAETSDSRFKGGLQNWTRVMNLKERGLGSGPQLDQL